MQCGLFFGNTLFKAAQTPNTLKTAFMKVMANRKQQCFLCNYFLVQGHLDLSISSEVLDKAKMFIFVFGIFLCAEMSITGGDCLFTLTTISYILSYTICF